MTLKLNEMSSEKKQQIKLQQVDESKNFTKPATFDNITSFIDFHSHFDMSAELNNLTYERKSLYLAPLLTFYILLLV